jgi:hypothetical protein
MSAREVRLLCHVRGEFITFSHNATLNAAGRAAAGSALLHRRQCGARVALQRCPTLRSGS